MSKKIIFGLFVLAVIAVGGYLLIKSDKEANLSAINSFEACVAEGYPILETYPEQCRTPDGRNFVKEITNPITPPTACTMEAKLCPDGSAVGRTGPNCEFAPCPSGNNGGSSTQSGVRGTVLLGPICPVEQNPPNPQCADRVFQTNLELVAMDGSRAAKLFSSNASGEFSVSVPPGSYFIRSAPGSPMLPTCSKEEVVVVRANTYTTTTVNCDTGIR